MESHEGLIYLPQEQLHSSGATTRSAANTAGWTQKMRDAFSDFADKATHAYEAASESVSHGVTKAKAAGAQKCSTVSCARRGRNGCVLQRALLPLANLCGSAPQKVKVTLTCSFAEGDAAGAGAVAAAAVTVGALTAL